MSFSKILFKKILGWLKPDRNKAEESLLATSSDTALDNKYNANSKTSPPQTGGKATENKTTGSDAPRQKIQKTYKLYIDGKFPRSESNRSYPVYGRDPVYGRGPVHGRDDVLLAHAVRASRKDLRNAVVAARSAQPKWAELTAYNRGQILYRVAEIMETRANALIEEVVSSGGQEAEVYESIDSWVWYAGWADKFSQVLGGANPVAGPYFNFTTPEPMGVVGIIAPDQNPLLGLVSRLAPALVSGNSVIAVASELSPLPAVALGEALAVSDVPPGIVNILTGHTNELAEHLISHADINAVDISGCVEKISTEMEILAADSVKRILKTSNAEQSPYMITDFCEMKTVWHPIGK